jgi:hypothetical protein
MTSENNRMIIIDGAHSNEVIKIFKDDGIPDESIKSILKKSTDVINQSVDPISGEKDQSSDGLLYGLIQSGKTSIITLTTALAADNGFRCVVILTSDIDLLYDQTLERMRRALRGLAVLGKNDWRDTERFQRQLRTSPFVIVCSKNSSKLNSLIEAFKTARSKGISSLIIDDEADQASLNTNTSKGGNQLSRINQAITDLRNYFSVNTYLQVTATPQALFLQRPSHEYRPSFTVLTDPGDNYVGGDEFFGEDSQLIEPVDIQEVNMLVAPSNPNPNGDIPRGLRKALFTFFIGATSKIILDDDNSYAFLCHVSVNTRDHQYIVNIIDRFKENVVNFLNKPGSKSYVTIITELKSAYDSLIITQTNLPNFDKVIEKIKFYLPGANIKLINALTEDEIKLDAAYNIFVGGNKLGRGVTIKNLIVSYYGRNPQRPNSDTVLQHARMYGYRQGDLGVTRLFLPQRLTDHFRLIHQMENGLREIVKKHPTGYFEGLYISSPLQATRRNVLDPTSIGMYVAGGYCNPAYPLRTADIENKTQALDQKLINYSDSEKYYETTVSEISDLVSLCEHDPNYGAELWNKKTIKSALEKINTLKGPKAYIRVRRGRNLEAVRRETSGFLTGGEESEVPDDSLTLFIYRLNKGNKGVEAWWPQLRWPEGNYVLAFSFDR